MSNVAMDPRDRLARSISAEARVRLEAMRGFLARRAAPAIPKTQADFDAAADRSLRLADHLNRDALAVFAPTVMALKLGGVDVLEVRPSGHADDGTALIYVHGGGFVQGSAGSYLLTAALAAQSSGRRVISIDYTLAPRGIWTTILDQVVGVWSAVSDATPAARLGLIGDSAGGCIAAAATLLLRERGLVLPAALVLLSPVTDLASEGDTNITLAAVDYLDPQMLAAARDAYAPGADLRDPLVSPVHGDFTLGFPPTLLQVGTRELLLSDSVRLHRALRAAGQASRLEVYEGMPHVFQPFLAEAPEGRAAWAEIAAFWAEHLGT